MGKTSLSTRNLRLFHVRYSHITPLHIDYHNCTTLQSILQPNQLCSLFVLYYYTTICFITVVIFRKPYLRFKAKNTIYSNEEELRSTKSINWFSFLVYKMLLRTDRLVTVIIVIILSNMLKPKH